MATRRINLALQGGGAHGAFTWGVLDRFLEEDSLEIAGISGTSAGALNGAALKAGMAMGGREAARENLDWLWAQVGAVGDVRMAGWFRAFLPLAESWSDMTERFAPFSPSENMTRLFSPYDYGPLYTNPLERIVERFRYDLVCAETGPAFHVATTNVRTGKIRVFSGAEVSSAVLLASACLPTVFQAVEIKTPATGEMDAYWDGGYTGNPALFPLFAPDLPDDIVIVSINPMRRDALPRTSQDILDRINEISFNASLLSELRAINFVRRLIADGAVGPDAMKNVRLHLVSDDALMNRLSSRSKLSPTPGLLWELKAAGRAAADVFLDGAAGQIGTDTSVDLAQMIS